MAAIERDDRLRAEFRGRLDSSCALMTDHFYGLCKAARVECTGTTGGEATGQQCSEQEKLRRDGFHVAVHAERLASAGRLSRTSL